MIHPIMYGKGDVSYGHGEQIDWAEEGNGFYHVIHSVFIVK